MHLGLGSALFRVGGALYFVLIYDFVIGVFFFLGCLRLYLVLLHSYLSLKKKKSDTNYCIHYHNCGF